MSRVPFTSLVFRGPRFEEAAMPVDVLVELSAYRDLIVSMAEALYRQKNPGRVRVPKGFSSKLQLVLGSQRPGSTIPVLDRVYTGTGLLPNLGLEPKRDEFDVALDALRTTFDEAGRGVEFTHVDTTFAGRLLSLGKTLRDDESVILGTATDDTGPIVDRAFRRRIQQFVGGLYEEPIELIGTVRAADRDRDSFGLRTLDGQRVEVISPGALFSRVLDSLADDTVVRVPGTAQFDAKHERVGKVRAHDISLAEEGDDGCSIPLAGQFADLVALRDGWLDGEGEAYDAGQLDGVRQLLEALVVNAGLPNPFVYPQPEGRVQAEWSANHVEVAASFAVDADDVEVLATNLDTRDIREGQFLRRDPGAELRLGAFLSDALRWTQR